MTAEVIELRRPARMAGSAPADDTGSAPPTDGPRSSAQLIAEVARRTPLIGPNRSHWRGLTFYRFEQPQRPQWESVRSLSLCMVIQGRKRLRVGPLDHFYDPFHYLVLTRGMRFVAEIVEASTTSPFLSFVLQVEPAMVTRITADMTERALPPPPPASPRPDAYVAPCDHHLVGAVLRFLRALDREGDRRVLAPLYLQEVVYRVLQAEHCGALLEGAVREAGSNPVSAAIRYVQEDLSRPLSVSDLADEVNMSQSAFAHLFKSVTGESPYRFVKRLRLDRARVLLIEGGRSVSEVATAVGYSSLSYFINEFKRHFGVTPGDYAESLRACIPLAVARSTAL